jgi:hypothetical protein
MIQLLIPALSPISYNLHHGESALVHWSKDSCSWVGSKDHPVVKASTLFKPNWKGFNRKDLLQVYDTKSLFQQRYDTQHNNTQHNDTQHNETQHNDTQHNDTQNNNK